MPQLQKAIPVAIAPFKKLLRVVMRSPRRPETGVPLDRPIELPACF
jgi:hypothetical protein